MTKRNLILSTGTLAAALMAVSTQAQAPAAPEAFATSVEVGVDVASSYIFRGGTVYDKAVAQPYLNAEILEGLTLGVWSSMGLDDSTQNGDYGGKFGEVDLTVEYTLPTGKCPLGISLGYLEYLYPNSTAGEGTIESPTVALESDREVAVKFELLTDCALDKALSPTIDVYYGVDGGVDKDLYAELGLGHTFEGVAEGMDLEFGGNLGYWNPDSGADGLRFASLSAGLNVGILSVGVSYFFETDEDVQPIDEDVLGTVGLSQTF